MKKIVFLSILLISFCVVSYGQSDKESAIRSAVEHQMEIYPCSTLMDIYKNFFQDSFGPGHIISDTASAGRYLREELNSADSFSGVAYEPTGYLVNFYRVNLSVMKDMTSIAKRQGAKVENAHEFRFSSDEAHFNKMVTSEYELEKWINNLR